MRTFGWIGVTLVAVLAGAAFAVVAASRLLEQLDEPVYGGDL